MIMDSCEGGEVATGEVGLYGVSSATNLCGLGNQTSTANNNTEGKGEN